MIIGTINANEVLASVRVNAAAEVNSGGNNGNHGIIESVVRRR